jgi:hypothetical protein
VNRTAARWRLLLASRRVLFVVLLAIAFALLLAYQIAHGRPTCRRPSVPVGELDTRLETWNACATLSDDRQFHGLWVDTADGALFYPDITTMPLRAIGRADAWLLIDRKMRAQIYGQLPPSDRTVAFQVMVVSFDGSEYTLDRTNPEGLKRLYDVRQIRAFHLLRRIFKPAKEGGNT